MAVSSDDGQIWDTTCDFGAYKGQPVAKHIARVACKTAQERVTQWRDRRWLPGEPGQSVLDVGCANGNYAMLFGEVRGMQYTGCDNSDAMLRLARAENPGVQFVRGRLPLGAEDTSRLPFEDENFDLLFCTDVFHHLPASEAALRELWRVARRWVVLGDRAWKTGDRTIITGKFGEIMRFERLADLRQMVRSLCPEAEEHVVEEDRATIGEGESRVRVHVYYVMPKQPAPKTTRGWETSRARRTSSESQEAMP